MDNTKRHEELCALPKQTLQYFTCCYLGLDYKKSEKQKPEQLAELLQNNNYAGLVLDIVQDAKETVEKRKGFYMYFMLAKGKKRKKSVNFQEVKEAIERHYAFGYAVTNMLFECGSMEVPGAVYFAEKV